MTSQSCGGGATLNLETNEIDVILSVIASARGDRRLVHAEKQIETCDVASAHSVILLTAVALTGCASGTNAEPAETAAKKDLFEKRFGVEEK